jgi:hypothetical protein
MKPLQQCMGGLCTVRDKCAHYWAPQQLGVPPSERLCVPREDGEAMTMRPVELERERLAADPRFAAWTAGSAA